MKFRRKTDDNILDMINLRAIAYRALKLAAVPLAVQGAACTGQVIQPEQCLKFKDRVCQPHDVQVIVQSQTYKQYENDLIARTQLFLKALPACATEGISTIILDDKAISDAAGDYVCETRESSDGTSSANCHIVINLNWHGDDKEPLIFNGQRLWKYTLMHEVGHNVFKNTCDHGGFDTIAFDESGKPLSSDDRDFITEYSPFPTIKFPSAKSARKEDFAYSFASYVLDQASFLEKTGNSAMMADKYMSLLTSFWSGKEFPIAP